MKLRLQLTGILLITALWLTVGLITPCEAQKTPVAKSYVIGAQDVLEIKVWGHNDLSRSVPVSADGNFSFPLIGRIRAEGLTVRELENKIAKLLDKDYIVNPQVTITVTDFKSQKVFILGEVAKPGAYYLSKTDTLLEVISKAGGVTQNAGREIIIVRPTVVSKEQPSGLDDPTNDQIRVNLQALIAGDVQKNIQVQDNDTIYVPRASVFSVFGEVQKPGSFPLEKELTVLEAISIAGGPTENADPQKLELLRKEGDEQKKIVINLKEILKNPDAAEELMIQDGDVIYQPRAEFFFVMGEVSKPGRYRLEEGLTVTKAISLAGGYTKQANKDKIDILRDDDGKSVSHRAKLNELVQPQDILKIHKSFF